MSIRLKLYLLGLASASCLHSSTSWTAAQSKQIIPVKSSNNHKKNVLDTVTTIKPVQAIIASYLYAYDDLVTTLTARGERDITALAYAPSGQYIASACLAEPMQLWDTSSFTQPRSFGFDPIVWLAFFQENSYRSITFAPDSRQFAALNSGCANEVGEVIEIYDCKTGKQLKKLKRESDQCGHARGANAVLYSPCNRFLAIGSLYGIRILDARDYKLVHTLKTGANENRSIAFSPSGNHIATVDNEFYTAEQRHVQPELSDGTTLEIFDTQTKERVRSCHIPVLKKTTGYPMVAYSPCGKKIAVLGADSLTIFNTSTYERVYESKSCSYRIIAFSPDGICFALYHYYKERKTGPVYAVMPSEEQPKAPIVNRIEIWDARTYKLMHIIDGDTFTPATKLFTSPDGNFCVEGPNDKATLITKLVFSPDSKFLVAGTDTGKIIFWKNQACDLMYEEIADTQPIEKTEKATKSCCKRKSLASVVETIQAGLKYLRLSK